MNAAERRLLDAAVSVCKTFYGGPASLQRQHRLHNMLIAWEAMRDTLEPQPLRGKIAKSRVVDGNLIIEQTLP